MDKLIKYILDNLNKDNNTYLQLKLVSVVYNKDTKLVTFKFIYTGCDVTRGMKQEVINLISKYYKNRFEVDCKMKKAFLDDDALSEFVYRSVLQNCKSILNFSKEDISSQIQGEDAVITCNITDQFYDYLVDKKYDRTLMDELNNNFFGNFNVVLTSKEVKRTTDILKEKEEEIAQMIQSTTTILKPRTIDVELYDTFLGVAIESNVATEISMLKKPQEGVQICGKVKFFEKRSFVSKKKDAEGNAIEKEYFTFNLDDNSGKMHCVCFPSKVDFEAVSSLTEGREVTAIGDIEEFNGRINFKVKSMAYCKLPEVKEIIIEQKQAADKYIYIQPEPYISISQDNFFAVKKEPNEFLKQNEIVVFDLETTGLEYNKNEIIEIGAVKMKNGEIAETFTCFVKPTKPIPEEIVNLTHITDEMVKDAYTIDKVIPDFYKFCDGCVLMAYNIDFDYKFLNFQSTKLGYKFTNRQVDALYLARLNVAGAKNFQLKNICARLGVSLEGAHRAINDVIATAEVIKLISDNVSPK